MVGKELLTAVHMILLHLCHELDKTYGLIISQYTDQISQISDIKVMPFHRMQ